MDANRHECSEGERGGGGGDAGTRGLGDAGMARIRGRGEREGILRRVKETTAGIGGVLPEWGDEVVVARGRLEGATLWESFCENFGAVNGRGMTSVGELIGFLKGEGYLRGYCDPGLRESVGSLLEGEGIEVSYVFEREKVDDYGFGVTRGTGAIAETGSVVLDDLRTVDRLAALAPWVHVAVIEEGEVYETVGEAIAMLGEAPNVVWATGPSKTADVEGILIEGVHGPGEQVCLRLG